MKKIVAIIIGLSCSLVITQPLLKSMQQSIALQQAETSIYNNSEKNIWLELRILSEKGYMANLPHVFYKGTTYRVKFPILAMCISDHSIKHSEAIKTEVPKDQLALIVNSSAEIVISSITDNETLFSYEINPPKTIRIFNNSNKSILISYREEVDSALAASTGKELTTEAKPKDTVRLKQPILALSLSEQAEGITQHLAEDFFDELAKTSNSSAQIIVTFNPEASSLVYTFTIDKAPFISTPPPIKSSSSSSSEERVTPSFSTEKETAVPDLERREAGMDIHSGDQKNCIVS